MTSKNALFTLLTAFASRLRYPQLFLLTGAVFVVDLLIPDLIPFVDELLLGLLTLLLGSLKKKGKIPPDTGTQGERVDADWKSE